MSPSRSGGPPGTAAFRHFPNPDSAGPVPLPIDVARILGAEEAVRAEETMSRWPGQGATPLTDLPGSAAALGLTSVRCKDESGRFGLGSFKALGGAYAVFVLARDRLREEGRTVDEGALIRGGYQDQLERLTVCSATAGNHGRSVAWGARLVGCRCTIYIPAGADSARVAAIESEGAEVVRVRGTYDEAVRRAAAEAAERGWSVVSDTAYPGYAEIPRVVMRGYTVMAEEIVRAWPDPHPPTHVFLQCGVGGLAAALCAHLWARWGEARPRCIVVEPEGAACMQLTARAGSPTPAEGPLDTVMSCLACAEVSLLAWGVLATGADDYLVVSDAEAVEAVEWLGRGEGGDPPLPTRASGAAGFAGLLAAARDPGLREAVGLGGGSRIVVIVSEGAG